MTSSWRRLLAKLRHSHDDDHAEDLISQSKSLGTIPIDAVQDRQLARVSGVIRSVSFQPRTASSRTVEVEIDDGTRIMKLLWLGRYRISGINPGVNLIATGRVVIKRGLPTMFNPAYELLPERTK